MNTFTNLKSYGVLTEPATLHIQRRLPGPIERVWSYLTESDLRRQWLAAGTIEDAAIELVWRNSELTDPPGARPEGFGEEHRMKVRVLVFEPPHKLVISWGEKGEVSFELETIRDDVLLTLTQASARRSKHPPQRSRWLACPSRYARPSCIGHNASPVLGALGASAAGV